MRGCPEQSLRGMDLQVVYGRVGKPILKRGPVQSAIGGVPDADIRTHVDIGIDIIANTS